MRFAPEDDDLVATINTTPLVDVMLVLLIIFLITIPVVTHSVALRLPQEASVRDEPKPGTVTIAITRAGAVYWNQAPLDDDPALLALLRQTAAQTPQPDIEVRGDGDVRYEAVGHVLLQCQRAGIALVAFVTQPPAS